MKIIEKSQKLLLIIFFITRFIYAYILRMLYKNRMGALDSEISVNQITEAFEIHQDVFGISHIDATSDLDAYFGMGFVHAKDRLFQMEMLRRTASSELAAIIGESGISSDTFFIRLGIKNLAEIDSDEIDDDYLQLFKSYIDGINTYINSVKILPPEFYALDIKPKTWQIKDIMLLVRLLSFSFSPGWHTKLFRLDLAQSFTDKSHLLDPTFSLNSLSDLKSFTQSINISIDKFVNLYQSSNIDAFPKISGSNAWAINARLSKSGKPILASDPHLEPTAPGLLYATHVKGNKINAIGAGVPGIPGIFIGHNEYYAWGVTAGLANTSECILSNIVTDNEINYLDKALPKNRINYMKTKIKVRFMKDREVEHWDSENGSIINIDCNSSINSTALIVYCSSLLKNNLWKSSNDVWKANSIDEIHSILNNWKGASLNFVYATKDDFVGQKLVGSILQSDDSLSHLLPLNGLPSDGLNFFESEKLPSEENSTNGFVVTANNNPIKELTFGSDWAENWRYQRISYLLKGKLHDIESFKNIQLDQQSDALAILARLLCDKSSELIQGKLGHTMYNKIFDWDGDLSVDSEIASFMQKMYFELSKIILTYYMKDRHTELIGEFLYFNNTSASLSYRLQGWLLYMLNAIETEEVMDFEFNEIISTAMNNISGKYTLRNINKNAWGKMHFLHIDHLLSKIKILGKLWPSMKYSFGGDSNTINQAGYVVRDQSKILWAPVYRQIIDLSDFDKSVFQIINGNSGLPDNQFFNDSMDEYIKGEYRPLLFSFDKIYQNVHAKIKFQVV